MPTTGGGGGGTGQGQIAATESHDLPVITGTCMVGSLAATESRDRPAIVGVSAVGTMAARESRDTPAFVGRTPDAILTVQEGADTPAISAFFEPVGTLAPTEAADIPAIVGLFQRGVLAATEGHDRPSVSGAFRSSSTMAATERGDIPAFTGRTVYAALATQEAGDRGAIVATAAGIPPYFKVQEQRDIPLFLGGLPVVRYHVYANSGTGDPIDYSTPLATVDGTSWISGSLACPGTWRLAVRAFSAAGEEQNIDCVVRVTLDANGVDISDRPNPPVGLRAFPMGANTIRIEWHYPPVVGPKSPVGFHVYASPGAILSYGTPADTVLYSEGLFNAFTTELSGLVAGVPYVIGVRSFNASGEEVNQKSVLAEPSGSGNGPAAVVGLTAVATV